MNAKVLPCLLLLPLLESAWAAPLPIQVLKRSDVVFMYQADRKTYQDYGANVLAWGGTPTPRSLQEAEGVAFFGSVGMVTEFARYHERFPNTYEEGLCRNLEGKPFKVPWLTDHQHQGVPYWWCCTRQPLFRQYLSERVVATVKAGAHGVHIDDHLGTAGALGSGGCYCDRCVAEFPAYLKSLPAAELQRLGIAEPSGYDYRQVLRAWLAEKPDRKPGQHPLWPQWRVYQFRGAAQFMRELRALAAATAGRPVPMGANACLLWGPHLSDYQALDLFSAEIEHHASARAFSDTPLLGYRLADAVGRPLASTASGGDWAFIKKENLPGLVRGWIALGYASGHSLMAPHRQWCYTPQLGTHWYAGPREKFAPLCQFVRQQSALFDDCVNHADLTVALAQRTLDRDGAAIRTVCHALSAANLSFALALGGDEIVDHPLAPTDLPPQRPVLILKPDDFQPADRKILDSAPPSNRLKTAEEAISRIRPAAQLVSTAPVRLLPRVKSGAAVIHLLNWSYDAARDDITLLKDVRLRIDMAALRVAGLGKARFFAPGQPPQTLPVTDGLVTVPELGLWGILELGPARP